MAELRGLLHLPLPLPLVLAGSTGAALLAFGVTGLSGVEPQLARAADQVRQEQHRDPWFVPDVPAAPGTSTPTARHRLADCPESVRPSPAGKV
jgi:hypothetical protein